MSTKTAIIRQSQDDWNAISINICESVEQWDETGDFTDEGWITSTAHTFADGDVADFEPSVWPADIDKCLADMGWKRASDIAVESDFLQSCTVEKVTA